MIRIFLISIFFPILAFAQKTEFETFRTPIGTGIFFDSSFPQRGSFAASRSNNFCAQLP